VRGADFDFLYNLEEHYWWFVAMRRITDAIVGADLQGRSLRILDAGCGTGYNLRHYQDAGHSVYGFDIATEAVEGVRRRGFTKITQASVTDIPFQAESFDLVFSFDVLCQIPIETHRQAIADMHRVLRPGGLLFVRTPAFEWLRSSHDEDLHTQHRFSTGELRRNLSSAGFNIRVSTYANSLLFPIAVVRRVLKRFGIGTGTDVKPLPRGIAWIDPVFRRVLASEAAVLQIKGGLPFGLSAIVFAEKPR
jgi:SAM-dependent methyltransferase